MNEHSSDKKLIEDILGLIHRGDTEGMRRALLAAQSLGRPIQNLHLIRAVALETSSISFSVWKAIETELALFPSNDAASKFLQQLKHRRQTNLPTQAPKGAPLFSIVAVVGEDL